MKRFDIKDQERVEEAAQWIKKEMEKRGINVHQAKEKMGRVRVYVAPLHANHKHVYREVYAAALDKFADLGKDVVCEDADYPELLRGL